jgi:hypothetical protein
VDRRSPILYRSRKPLRWRAIAAALRAPGASVGDNGAPIFDRSTRRTGEPDQVGVRERTVIVECAQHQLLIERWGC